MNKRRNQQVVGRRARTASSRARNNLRRSIDRWAERTSARAASSSAIGLIGLDVSRVPFRFRTRAWIPIVAAAVAGSMFLAVLRMDVIRMRFGLAQAFEEELRLGELKREWTVQMRQLRDPAILTRTAQRLGFRRAEQLIDLDPAGGAPIVAPAHDPRASIELASVSSRRTMHP